jgi:hypothetical protein
MKVTLVPWLQDAKGKSGDTVFKNVKGQTVITKKPRKRKTPYSAKEVAVHTRFTDASDYAEMVMLHPPLLALYEQAAEKSGRSAYQLAREDWFDAPTVSFSDGSLVGYEGHAGDIIKFKIRDEIAVERVIVTLSDDDTGDLIEKGPGVPEVAGSKFWMYTATKAVPSGVTVVVRVEAYDHPGNFGHATGSKKIVAA